MLVTMSFSIVSCKKDYVCECSKTYTTSSGSSTYDYSVYTYNDTQTRAETRCNDNVETGHDLGGEYAVNCRIK
jgi:hypothetical protein